MNGWMEGEWRSESEANGKGTTLLDGGVDCEMASLVGMGRGVGKVE